MTEPLIRNIKLCGLTKIGSAEHCVKLGFGAIGYVFFRRSPRYLSPIEAGEISQHLPADVAKVGVFVDESVETMLDIATLAGLTTLQLHGNEPVTTIETLQKAGYRVVKVLHTAETAQAILETLPPQTSVLLECSRGDLPGGNGASWNWSAIRQLKTTLPLGIAGGLNPANIKQAIADSGAIAYDISSGVEAAPGVKDEHAIRLLRDAVENIAGERLSFWK